MKWYSVGQILNWIKSLRIDRAYIFCTMNKRLRQAIRQIDDKVMHWLLKSKTVASEKAISSKNNNKVIKCLYNVTYYGSVCACSLNSNQKGAITCSWNTVSSTSSWRFFSFKFIIANCIVIFSFGKSSSFGAATINGCRLDAIVLSLHVVINILLQFWLRLYYLLSMLQHFFANFILIYLKLFFNFLLSFTVYWVVFYFRVRYCFFCLILRMYIHTKKYSLLQLTYHDRC